MNWFINTLNKLKKQVKKRILNPIVYHREKVEKIAKGVILNKPVIQYKKLWLDGIDVKKKVVYINKQEDLFNFVTGWINMNRDIIYLCNIAVKIDSSEFNSDFELVITDNEWKVTQIFKNISPTNKQIFEFKKESKLIYFWIAKTGFCDFNKIKLGTKLSTNYRSSDLEFPFL